jgi:hypothetical protein
LPQKRGWLELLKGLEERLRAIAPHAARALR